MLVAGIDFVTGSDYQDFMSGYDPDELLNTMSPFIMLLRGLLKEVLLLHIGPCSVVENDSSVMIKSSKDRKSFRYSGRVLDGGLYFTFVLLGRSIVELTLRMRFVVLVRGILCNVFIHQCSFKVLLEKCLA